MKHAHIAHQDTVAAREANYNRICERLHNDLESAVQEAITAGKFSAVITLNSIDEVDAFNNNELSTLQNNLYEIEWLQSTRIPSVKIKW